MTEVGLANTSEQHWFKAEDRGRSCWSLDMQAAEQGRPSCQVYLVLRPLPDARWQDSNPSLPNKVSVSAASGEYTPWD